VDARDETARRLGRQHHYARPDVAQVILFDANVLVYAMNADAPQYAASLAPPAADT